MSAFDIGENLGRETACSVREVYRRLDHSCCSFLPLIEMFHYTGQEIQRKLEPRLQIEQSAESTHCLMLLLDT